MRTPVAPCHAPSGRRLRPAAAVLLGMAGIVLAVIVLVAGHAR